MSYEIIDGRQFIRTTRGILPMILGGSNNCTMVYGNREIRERSWFIMYGEKWLEIPECELLVKAEELFGGEHLNEEHSARYGGKWLSGADFLFFVKRGVKYAKTIEEIRTLCPGQYLECYVSYYKEDDWKCGLRGTIKETAALEAWLDSARKRKNELQKDAHNKYVSIHISLQGIKPLNIETALLGKDRKGAVIVKVRKNAYVSEVTERFIHFTLNIEDAMEFPTTEEAIVSLPQSLRPYRLISASAKEEAKKKKIILMVESGLRAGCYIYRLGKHRLSVTSTPKSAKRFSSENAALKWFNEYVGSRFVPGVQSVKPTLLLIGSGEAAGT